MAEEIFLKELGSLLRDCRNQTGMSIRDFAKKVFIHYSYISKIETGKLDKLPSADVFARMINQFQLHHVEDGIIRRIEELVIKITISLERPSEGLAHLSIAIINEQISSLPVKDRDAFGKDLITLSSLSSSIKSVEKKTTERDWGEVESALPVIRKQVNQLNDYSRRIYRIEGLLNYSKGKYAESREAYIHVLASIQKIKQFDSTDEEKQFLSLDEAQIYVLLGDCERRMASFDHAIFNFQMAQDLFNAIDTRESRISVGICHRKISAVYNHIGQPPRAIELLEDAERIAEAENDPVNLYKAWQHRAWSRRLLGFWDDSIQINLKAFNLLCETTDDQYERLRGHNYLGDSFRIAHQDKDAREHYKLAIGILEHLKKPHRELGPLSVTIYLGYGQVLQNMGELRLAKDYLLKSRQQALAMKEEMRFAQVENELANMELLEGNRTQAKLELEYSVETLRRVNAIYSYYISLYELCKVYLELKEYQNIYLKVKDAVKWDNGNVNVQLARLRVIEAKAQIEEGHIDKACQTLVAALENARLFNEWVFKETKDVILAIGNSLFLEGKVRLAELVYDVFDEYILKNRLDVSGIIADFQDEFSRNKKQMSLIRWHPPEIP